MAQAEFPKRGLNDDTPFGEQPAMTTRDALNVRTIDPSTGRSRGAQRSGTTKFLQGALNGAQPVQALAQTMRPRNQFTLTNLGSNNLTTTTAASGSVEITGTITIRTAIPGFTVGDRVTISDGTTAITFEASFQDDNASDSSYVAWEANPNNAPLTMARFAQKINEQSFSIGAAVDSTNSSKVLLQNTDAGSGALGNVAIVVQEDLVTTDWAATGMSGGTGGGDDNTIEVEWQRRPADATETSWIELDGNNVWTITDRGVAELYNPDGVLVNSIAPRIPEGFTIVNRVAVASDSSVYLACKSDDGKESRVWRFYAQTDVYDEKWEYELPGTVRQLQAAFGALYVVSDCADIDGSEYENTPPGIFVGLTGLSLSTPLEAFRNECPMPVTSMDISNQGLVAMAHPAASKRGFRSASVETPASSAPDLWTPWDLTNYRERLYFWCRAEDAVDENGSLITDIGDRVGAVPEHRLSPPDGYELPYDDTDRRLVASSDRLAPSWRTENGGRPYLAFSANTAEGTSPSALAGTVLVSNGDNSVGNKGADPESKLPNQQRPIPSDDSLSWVTSFLLRLPSNTTDQQVFLSFEQGISGGPDFGIIINTEGGLYASTLVDGENSIWVDVDPRQLVADDINNSGDATSTKIVRYSDEPGRSGSARMALVTLVWHRDLAQDRCVVRVNGRHVDTFRGVDRWGGSNGNFSIGCRRAAADGVPADDVYENSSVEQWNSFTGRLYEWVTVLGDSNNGVTANLDEIPCPRPDAASGRGAIGGLDIGYADSGSVPHHDGRDNPTSATEVELLEGYLAHKYGVAYILPRSSSSGDPRSSFGYYEAHPFGGPGWLPEGPNATSKSAFYRRQWTNGMTFWSAGGNLIGGLTGAGMSSGVGWDGEARLVSGGKAQAKRGESLDNETSTAYRRTVFFGSRAVTGKCATATIDISASVSVGATLTLTDNSSIVTFEFTNTAPTPGNVRVDTSVTATSQDTKQRLIALEFLDRLDESALDIVGFMHGEQNDGSDEHSVQLIQEQIGVVRELNIAVTGTGLTAPTAFSGAEDTPDGGWLARVPDDLDRLSVDPAVGTKIRFDSANNIYLPDTTLTSVNSIVRRSKDTGSVQWRYLFLGSETANAVIPLGDPLSYAGASLDGPEFVFAASRNGPIENDTLWKLRILRVDEDLTGQLSTREAIYLGVCGGSVVKFERNGTAQAVTGGDNLFSAGTPYIQTAVVQQKVFFTDGISAHYYDVEEDAVKPYISESRGAPPVRFRLLASWRNRLVAARVAGDETNWYMSRSGDPFDWDENPPIVDAQQPVSGDTSKGRVGQAPDVINALVPWSDDLLIIGGDRSIWRMTGDPMQGGQVDLVSDSTGMAFGSPWTKDPNGTLYFFGSRGGVWRMPPGGLPERITTYSIERRLRDLDLGSFRVSMVWNYYDEGLHVIPVPYNLSSVDEVRSWFYDAKHDAWWEDSWMSSGNGVTAVLLVDGDLPDDRRVLMGCQDGIVRYVDPAAVTDDEFPIDSQVLIGPLMGPSAEHESRFTRMTGVLGATLGPVSYEVLVGEDYETAEVVDVGYWNPGRNPISPVRWTGPAAWIRLASAEANAWALESLHVDVIPTTRKRTR